MVSRRIRGTCAQKTDAIASRSLSGINSVLLVSRLAHRAAALVLLCLATLICAGTVLDSAHWRINTGAGLFLLLAATYFYCRWTVIERVCKSIHDRIVLRSMLRMEVVFGSVMLAISFGLLWAAAFRVLGEGRAVFG